MRKVRINVQYFARLCSKDETKAKMLTNIRLLHLFFCSLCFCCLFTCDSSWVYFVVLNCHISYLHILSSGNGIQASEAVFLVLFSFPPSLSCPTPCSNTHLPCLFIPSPSYWCTPVKLFKPGFPYCSIPKVYKTLDLVCLKPKIDRQCLNKVPIKRLAVKCTVNGYLCVCLMTHKMKPCARNRSHGS